MYTLTEERAVAVITGAGMTQEAEYRAHSGAQRGTLSQPAVGFSNRPLVRSIRDGISRLRDCSLIEIMPAQKGS